MPCVVNFICHNMHVFGAFFKGKIYARANVFAYSKSDFMTYPNKSDGTVLVRYSLQYDYQTVRTVQGLTG